VRAKEGVYVSVCICFAKEVGFFFGLRTCLYMTCVIHSSNLVCEHVFMHIRVYTCIYVRVHVDDVYKLITHAFMDVF